ncbi:MAG: 2-dehydropantoate 2-reductase [Halieaceae bacterium]|jgi:2-dehydropantoate 2-reductase
MSGTALNSSSMTGQKTERINWHVLGAGAIGCLFAAKFSASNIAVSLLLRSDTALNLLEECGGITLHSQGETQTLALAATTCAEPGGTIARLLVTTKAHQAVNAVASVAHRLSSESIIVLLHNGMGVYEEVRRCHPHLNIVCAVTTEAAYQQNKFEIMHAGSGLSSFGKLEGTCSESFLDDFRSAGFTVQWDENIEWRLWHKLAINCCINPLTALHNCRNGALLDGGEREEMLGLLCVEVAAVLEALGFQIDTEKLRGEVRAVALSTSENQSSMLQDVLRGTQTEVDFINGHLLATAGKLGLHCPYNQAVWKKLKKRELQTSQNS